VLNFVTVLSFYDAIGLQSLPKKKEKQKQSSNIAE